MTKMLPALTKMLHCLVYRLLDYFCISVLLECLKDKKSMKLKEIHSFKG